MPRLTAFDEHASWRRQCGILGDGVNQAADLISDATSIPSLTPLMTFRQLILSFQSPPGRGINFYNCAIEHPSVYVIEEKRICWAGSDPVGYLGFWRARSVIDRAVDAAKAPRANYPRALWKRMDSFNLASLGGQAQGLWCNLQQLRRIAQIEQRLDAIGGDAEYRDTIVRTQRVDALARQAVAVAGLEIVAV